MGERILRPERPARLPTLCLGQRSWQRTSRIRVSRAGDRSPLPPRRAHRPAPAHSARPRTRVHRVGRFLTEPLRVGSCRNRSSSMRPATSETRPFAQGAQRPLVRTSDAMAAWSDKPRTRTKQTGQLSCIECGAVSGLVSAAGVASGVTSRSRTIRLRSRSTARTARSGSSAARRV